MAFKDTVKEWFKTGFKPTQAQFYSKFDFLRWKDEKIPITDIEDIEGFLNGKADAEALSGHLTNEMAHAVLFAGKEDKINKGVAGGYVPLDEFAKITSQYLNLINDLVTGGVTNVLSAEMGKVLRTQITAINTLLTSDDVNLDTVQELVDAIKQVETSLETILVNDLVTGGVTKALTAEMGKLLEDTKANQDGSNINQSSFRTALGLGSNAYNSTAFLPITGGPLTGNLETRVIITRNSDYDTLRFSGSPADTFGIGSKLDMMDYIYHNYFMSFASGKAHAFLNTGEVIFDGNATAKPAVVDTQLATLGQVKNLLPKSYSTLVYVNSNSPLTATIFDTENPPVTNDNALKNNVNNLYVGANSTTWVYNGTTYKSEDVADASNFYLSGTTIPAGNNKVSQVERNGAIKAGGFVKKNPTYSNGILIANGVDINPLSLPVSTATQIELNKNRMLAQSYVVVSTTNTTNTTLFTYTLPAGTLEKDGDFLEIFTTQAVGGKSAVGQVILNVNGSDTIFDTVNQSSYKPLKIRVVRIDNVTVLVLNGNNSLTFNGFNSYVGMSDLDSSSNDIEIKGVVVSGTINPSIILKTVEIEKKSGV